jgi:hypothetical protein
MRSIWLALTFLACSGDKGEVSPTGETGTDDTNTGSCRNAILSQYPEGGEAEVFAWSAVDVTLSAADTAATIAVVDGSGAEVAGAVSLLDADKRLEWRPASGMAPGPHTATLTWTGCEPVAVDFTVHDAATAPVTDTSSLVGKTYILDLTQGRFVAPEGIGSALQTLIEVRLLMGVVAVDAGGISLLAGAEADGGGQDLAAATTAFSEPASFLADPHFTAEQPTLPLVVQGDGLTVTNLTMSGSFSSDGSAVEGFRLSAVLDTRDLKDALSITDDNGVCDLFGAAYGVTCEACPGGDGDYCITLVIADLTLPEAGYTMVEVP